MVTSVRSLAIKTKLIVLLLAFGLVPALALFLVFASLKGDFEEAYRSGIKRTAVAIGDTIDRNLFERYGDVQAFGLNAAARAPENWRRHVAGNPLIEAMNGYMTGYGIYRLMMLVDAKGDVLAVNDVNAKGEKLDTAALYDRGFADAPWFKNAVAGRFLDGKNGFTGTVVEQPTRDATVARLYGDDGYVIAFAAPVKAADGAVLGVWVNFADFGLVEEIVATFHNDMVAEGKRSAEITLLDAAGRVIVDYDPVGLGWTTYRRDFGVVGKLNLAERGVTAAAAAVKGESGSMDSLHARKKIVQAAGFAHTNGAYDYPGLGWSVLVRVPTEEFYATTNTVERFMLIAIALSSAIILALGFLVGTAAGRSIRAMTTAMTRLSGGDATVEVPARGRGDEIGEMAKAVQVFKDNMIDTSRLRAEQEASKMRAEQEKRQALNNMADAFEASVKGVVRTVSSAASEMQASAQSMSATVKETSRQATAVAAASEEASTNVQTVASAAEELSASIAEISRQVGQSTKIAGKAVDDARRTNGSVQGLAEAAQKIGDVVRLINDIAGQTNLLALNATIEAARAGEAGKGFTVVASEVKSLANQTTKATEDIAAQIAAIQAATRQAVDDIKTIGATIGEVSEIATAIAAAVEEQGAATQEIARNVQQASAGTNEVSQNIAGVTQASAETGAGAAQVLSAADELAKQSAVLSTEVDKFVATIRAA